MSSYLDCARKHKKLELIWRYIAVFPLFNFHLLIIVITDIFRLKADK